MVCFDFHFNRSNLLEAEKVRWAKEKQDLEFQLNCKAEELDSMKESLLSTTAELQTLQNQHKELEKQRNFFSGCVKELKYV